MDLLLSGVLPSPLNDTLSVRNSNKKHAIALLLCFVGETLLSSDPSPPVPACPSGVELAGPGLPPLLLVLPSTAASHSTVMSGGNPESPSSAPDDPRYGPGDPDPDADSSASGIPLTGGGGGGFPLLRPPQSTRIVTKRHDIRHKRTRGAFWAIFGTADLPLWPSVYCDMSRITTPPPKTPPPEWRENDMHP